MLKINKLLCWLGLHDYRAQHKIVHKGVAIPFLPGMHSIPYETIIMGESKCTVCGKPFVLNDKFRIK